MSQPEMKEELIAGVVDSGWDANTQGARRKMLMLTNTWCHGRADERDLERDLFPLTRLPSPWKNYWKGSTPKLKNQQET